MIQIVYYETPDSFDLTTKNMNLDGKKPSQILKEWEDANPEAVFKYTKTID